MNEPPLSTNDMTRTNRGRTRIAAGIVGVVVVSLFVAFALSGSAVAHTGDEGVHHHDGWMGTHGGMWDWGVGGPGFLWMILLTVVLIGIPVAFAYWLFAGRETPGDGTDDALAVLRRRYAQGEIDEDEFESRRARLVADQE